MVVLAKDDRQLVRYPSIMTPSNPAFTTWDASRLAHALTTEGLAQLYSGLVCLPPPPEPSGGSVYPGCCANQFPGEGVAECVCVCVSVQCTVESVASY